ncbi:MAG: flagellar hook-basal body complex protein FliE [Oligoflexales bacterium]|nr:flagellar hook-basal body complex protein FliE [Oligoflexales bacterium]
MSRAGIAGIDVRQKLIENAMNSEINRRKISISDEDANTKSENKKMTFMDHLKEGIEEVNEFQKNSDKMSLDLATGKEQNIHETMLAATQAELAFNLMVQIRNKALDAYQEVMRMPV